jgi:hypothetical protein
LVGHDFSTVPVHAGQEIRSPSKQSCHQSLNDAALAQELAANPTILNPAFVGKSLCEDFFNFGIGTVQNDTKKTFSALASAGKNEPMFPTRIRPGFWGGGSPAPGPNGEKLTDIDFLIPTPANMINGQASGKFKVGSNDAELTIDAKEPDNSLLDDFTDYVSD